MSDEMKNQVDPDQKVTDAAVTPAENTSPADTQAEQTPVSPAPETAPQPETPQEAESLQKFCPQCGAPLAPDGCRTDFADIQNKKECGGNRQWQRQFLRKWAANTKGKAII